MTVEGSQTVQATTGPVVLRRPDRIPRGGPLPNQPGRGTVKASQPKARAITSIREDSARPVDVNSGDHEAPARYSQEQATGQHTPIAVANCHHRSRDRRQRQSQRIRAADIVGDAEEPTDLGTSEWLDGQTAASPRRCRCQRRSQSRRRPQCTRRPQPGRSTRARPAVREAGPNGRRELPPPKSRPPLQTNGHAVGGRKRGVFLLSTGLISNGIDRYCGHIFLFC
jgi:hypothetical protein